MNDRDDLRTMFRRDLNAALELPPREQWRARRDRTSAPWTLALAGMAVLALLIAALAIGSQVAQQREQRLNPTVTASPASVASATPGPAGSVGSGITGAAYLSGKVTSERTGEPIYGAFVAFMYDDGSCCRWQDEDYTDQSGNFRVLVTNGRYRVVVQVPMSGGTGPATHYFNGPGLSTVAYAPQWWKGAAEFEAAQVIEIKGANINGLDFALQPGHVISGRMTTAKGTTVSGAIHVMRAGSASCCSWFIFGESDWTQHSDEGTYRIAVPNGVYRLRFRGPARSSGADPQNAFQWWRDAQDFEHATDIVVHDQDVQGVDVVFSEYGF